MISKDIAIYICSNPENWNLSLKVKHEIAQHCFTKFKGREYLWAKNMDSNIIIPKNFMELKKNLNLKEILIIDRIKGTDEIISIVDHINRSGQNFLRSKTPENDFPQFPDMSKIYHKINGFKTAVVHTLGNDRFKNPPHEKNIIWSESVGLIASVAHYVGIKVFALGGEDPNNIIKLF